MLPGLMASERSSTATKSPYALQTLLTSTVLAAPEFRVELELGGWIVGWVVDWVGAMTNTINYFCGFWFGSSGFFWSGAFWPGGISLPSYKILEFAAKRL